MITINEELAPINFSAKLNRFWELSGEKINLIEKDYDESKGSPVFTIEGNILQGAGLNGRRVSNTVLPFSSMTLRKKKIVRHRKSQNAYKNG